MFIYICLVFFFIFYFFIVLGSWNVISILVMGLVTQLYLLRWQVVIWTMSLLCEWSWLVFSAVMHCTRHVKIRTVSNWIYCWHYFYYEPIMTVTKNNKKRCVLGLVGFLVVGVFWDSESCWGSEAIALTYSFCSLTLNWIWVLYTMPQWLLKKIVFLAIHWSLLVNNFYMFYPHKDQKIRICDNEGWMIVKHSNSNSLIDCNNWWFEALCSFNLQSYFWTCGLRLWLEFDHIVCIS